MGTVDDRTGRPGGRGMSAAEQEGQQDQGLSALLHEGRRFEPPQAFVAQANAKPGIYEEADADPLSWWEEQARSLEWAEPWTEVLDWQVPFAKWFVGGKLNASVNCLDRHVAAGRGDKVAFHWVGEPEGDTRDITYAALKDMVCQAANALVELGVEAGDRVCIYMPMIPEAVVAMLACARLGAPHMVTFGGFSAEALASRILDGDARIVITADGGYRRGSEAALKPNVDEALKQCPEVASVLVVRRTGQDVDWEEGRDRWWHEVVDRQSTDHDPQAFDAEQPLYIMYTSGTTAKPKGILHTTGGYLTHCATTHRLIFDVKPDTDIFWTAADIGWVTGHSYIVYGPLANGVTSMMYEGTPDAGGRDRWWKIIEDYKVTILYTAPTTIRTFMKWGEEYPTGRDLSSLRLLGSVGEPINPEAWMWYRKFIGGDRCPIVDTWWQTETGGIMITPLPGITATKPGAAMRPFPGISADVVDEGGKSVGNDAGGYLVLDRALAGHAPGDLGRSQALRGDLLVPLPRALLRRRRSQARRGRRPVVARPGRRRHEHLRAPHLHHRGGTRPGRVPAGGRGGRGRGQRPHDRSGHRGLRHREGRGVRCRERGRCAGGRASRPRGQGHRAHRQAPPDHPDPRPAQDQEREDHAPLAQRRGRTPGAGRRHHPHGPDGGQPDR